MQAQALSLFRSLSSSSKLPPESPDRSHYVPMLPSDGTKLSVAPLTLQAGPTAPASPTASALALGATSFVTTKQLETAGRHLTIAFLNLEEIVQSTYLHTEEMVSVLAKTITIYPKYVNLAGGALNGNALSLIQKFHEQLKNTAENLQYFVRKIRHKDSAYVKHKQSYMQEQKKEGTLTSFVWTKKNMTLEYFNQYWDFVKMLLSDPVFVVFLAENMVRLQRAQGDIAAQVLSALSRERLTEETLKAFIAEMQFLSSEMQLEKNFTYSIVSFQQTCYVTHAC